MPEKGPLDALATLEPGDTRPLVRLRVGDTSPWGIRRPGEEAKTALLIAEQVVLLDPMITLSDYYREARARRPDSYRLTRSEFLLAAMGRGRQTSEHTHAGRPIDGLTREEWLTRALEQYAVLASAIRRGIVEVLPIDPAQKWGEYQPGEVFTSKWEQETGGSRDDGAFVEAFRDLLLKISVASRSPGLVNPVARPGVEEDVLAYFYRTLYPKRDLRQNQPHSEVARLLSLRLPGVDFAKVEDLVQIRDENVFADFRGAVRNALNAASQEERLGDAQTAAEAVFRDAHLRTGRSISRAFRDALSPKAASYAVGVAVGTAVGYWQAVLPYVADASTKAIMDIHRTKARRAQRNLYLALSNGPTHTR